eukprot:705237-Hanusia_phi.AAC.1
MEGFFSMTLQNLNVASFQDTFDLISLFSCQDSICHKEVVVGQDSLIEAVSSEVKDRSWQVIQPEVEERGGSTDYEGKVARRNACERSV